MHWLLRNLSALTTTEILWLSYILTFLFSTQFLLHLTVHFPQGAVLELPRSCIPSSQRDGLLPLPSRKRRTMSLLVVFSCSHSLLQQCPLPSTTVSKATACNLTVEETVFFFLRRCQHIHFQSSHFLFLQKKMTGQHSHQSIFLTHASFYNFYRANCLCLRRLSRCQY